jgi:hypothetical protein
MQTSNPTLEIPLRVFVVFYAIGWGMLANVLPRWKAFDTGRFCVADRQDRRWVQNRLVWSLLWLTLMPALYFAGWLVFFGPYPTWHLTSWGFRSFALVFSAALAAWLPPFGFYRIWVSGVQRCAKCFYPLDWEDCKWDRRFPDLPKDDLDPDHACGNLLWAGINLAISLGLPPIVLFFVR